MNVACGLIFAHQIFNIAYENLYLSSCTGSKRSNLYRTHMRVNQEQTQPKQINFLTLFPLMTIQVLVYNVLSK